MTAIKICGLTRSQDIQAACKMQVNAIGLVFYPPSPRYVSPVQASALAVHIPAFVQSVGLFVNPVLADISKVNHLIDIIQFHGDESAESCQKLAQLAQKRWIKALTVKPTTSEALLTQQIQHYRQAGASAILLDAWHPDLKGGTGHSFDWRLFPSIDCPIILAGGLTPYNVASAVALTSPYAVDVSGGVEVQTADGSILKGVKDAQKIRSFVQQVHQAK